MRFPALIVDRNHLQVHCGRWFSVCNQRTGWESILLKTDMCSNLLLQIRIPASVRMALMPITHSYR